MRAAPQMQCQKCGLPIVLTFVEVVDDTRRRLRCPLCDHVHLWSIVELRNPDNDARPSLGSSVE